MMLRQKSSGAGLAIFLIMLSSLWDFYHPLLEIRVFDFAIFGLILFLAIITFIQSQTHLKFHSSDTPNILLVSLLIVIYGLVSVFIDVNNFKSVFGIILCMMTFLFFYNLVLDNETIVKSMNILLITNISFMMFQYVTFIVTGQVFNPFDFLGIDVRLTGGNVFRPAGLFREPASFALMIFSFIITKLSITSKFDFLSYLGCLAIFLSLSLWGLIAVLLLLTVWHWRSPFLHLAVGLAAMFIVLYWKIILEVGENMFLLNRLLNIQDDGSANERYGGGETELLSNPVFWFGQGPSTENYQYFGGISFGYLLSSWGLLSSLVIFFLLMQQASTKRNRPIAFFGLGLALTASTIWTMAYWWLWIALLLKPDFTKREDNSLRTN